MIRFRGWEARPMAPCTTTGRISDPGKMTEIDILRIPPPHPPSIRPVQMYNNKTVRKATTLSFGEF